MSAVVIIQARMTSTRLPGKVLMPLGGKPILERVIERVRLAQSVGTIVVATTINAADDPLVDFCRQLDVPVFRGSEQDVLSRYAGALAENPGEPVVRITSDCPLIDPWLIDHLVERYRREQEGGMTYVSNMLHPSYPYGMAVEVFSAAALREAQARSVDPVEREHVTPFIYRHPERFKLVSDALEADFTAYRCTVDTPEDYVLVSKVFDAVQGADKRYTFRDVIAVLDANPQWMEINRHIEQVKVQKVRP